jgi:hypothetical protein
MSDEVKVKKSEKIINLFTTEQIKELKKLVKVKHLISQSTVNTTVINIMQHY